MGDEFFLEDDPAILFDRKERRLLVFLKDGGVVHTHTGTISHDLILGQTPGVEVRTTSGAAYFVFRPTLSDFVLEMQRGPQIIYPKDLGQILAMADIYPGLKILESGLGSGALSIALLRVGVKLIGYELRSDYLERAIENTTAFLGEKIVSKNYKACQRDIYEGIGHKNLDRIMLDLPEPWLVVPHIPRALKNGGLVLAYTPSITQAARFTQCLSEGPFTLQETIEVLNRSWHIAGHSLRPSHKMVAHTGFLTTARKLAGTNSTSDTLSSTKKLI